MRSLFFARISARLHPVRWASVRQGFDFLCGGQGGGWLVEAFELLEQVDEQVRFRFLFPLSREEGMQH